MSSDRVPSRAEVTGWSPQQLADYLKRNLSDNDLQKFPKLHAPRGPKYFAHLSVRQDEFDDDYESPFSGDEDEGSGGDYESPNEDLDGANDYEPPPTEPPEDLVHKLCPTLPIADSDYIGRAHSLVPPSDVRLHMNTPEHIHEHLKASRSTLRSIWSKLYLQQFFIIIIIIITFHMFRPQLDSPNPPTWSKPPVLPLASTSVSRSNSSARPPPNRSSITLMLGQAEGCLKRVNKDGAFLVRDSTRQQANQPFTLMVLYQDKVYNIQIRQHNHNFLLGTGLKVQEFFPSVIGIVGHYSQNPLLLIDAKNRASGQQNQCMLADPAGYQMSRQQWS
uniref:SH2 domain-containing protein n=1 Tax=Cyclopterus lumpus TaxID=8103 RepID=A0A8C2XA95_CYCLU